MPNNIYLDNLTPAQRQSLENFRYILRNMEDAVCLTSMDGELLYANAAGEKLLGIKPESHLKIWERIPFIEQNDELIELFIKSVMDKQHKQQRAVVDYVNQEGKAFRLHVSVKCQMSDETDGKILVVITDLTHLSRVQSAFQRYTSPEIAEYVLTDPQGSQQGGEEREVSILMSDLRGFTALSTGMSSTELINVLNHYFEIMADIIRKHKGTIIEFLGDGIFVVFGAPQDLPEHAREAVICAIEMQNAMEEVNAWNREMGYPLMEMGIGISTGDVVAGNIGSNQKMKYGCMGATVNLAGRLESCCIGGQIKISENTRNQISDELNIVEENTFIPKGFRNGIKYFSIAGLGEQHVAEDQIRWREIPGGTAVQFYILNGKIVEGASNTGRITEVSVDGKYGKMETESGLLPLQELMISLGGEEAYAKVLKREGKYYRIGFTLNPESFSAKLEKR